VESVVAAREAELKSARDELGFFKTPLTILRLFGMAALEFLVDNMTTLATSKATLFFVYPLVAAWLYTRSFHPNLYDAPDCAGKVPGLLFYPSLVAYESAWWLVLGILSSIGLGTGLHSGIMFLWPFCMSVIVQTEACGSTAFSATYNHPCSLTCEAKDDGSVTFFNTLLLLWPSVIVWGSGTAMGELPPYFITRAAKRAGARATDYEAELAEAAEGTDLISKLKVWTIDFTERHGFMGILLLASWPNAAFDMCGMACGWLEMPFWTFFGATLLGKGFFKVTLQATVCIVVFGRSLWDAMLAMLPAMPLPALACDKAGVKEGACTLPAFLTAGRGKAMHKFTLQSRMLPTQLLDGAAYLDEASLTDKYCAVQSVCGDKNYRGGYTDAPKYAEMQEVASRVMAALDTNGDGTLVADEIGMAAGTSDGKLSLASIDPGTGGLLSVGNLWNLLIAGLVGFFIYSIVEQVALVTQQAYDSAEIEELEAKLTS